MSQKWRELFGFKAENSGSTTNSDTSRLACVGCGKVGVSICAKCAKKPACLGKVKTKTAKKATAQREIISDDAGFYGRLEGMSQLSFEGNKESWGRLCLEIGANKYYLHLELLAGIVHEGKWRKGVRNLKAWLRKNIASRVERLEGKEDYGPQKNAKRRAYGPDIDRRDGALTAFAERPFAEFEVPQADGDAESPEEAIEGRIERQKMQTAGSEDEDGYEQTLPMHADKNSLRSLGRRRTFAEHCEASRCDQMVYFLNHNRPAFDKALAGAITNISLQRPTGRMGLDQDEIEVLAVITLLSEAGPRMYLNFLDGADKKRLRNAWDRVDRKRKNPEWATLFRKALKESSNQTRTAWSKKYWGDYYRSIDRQGWQHLVSTDHDKDYSVPFLTRDELARWAEILAEEFPTCTCGALDHRFCTCGRAPARECWVEGGAIGSMRSEPGDFDEVVKLDSDLSQEEKRIYSAYEKKRNSCKISIPRKLSSP